MQPSEGETIDLKSYGALARLDLANRCRDHLVLYGWVLGLAKRVARAEIRYGELVIDLLGQGFAVPRPDVSQHFSERLPSADDLHGFYLALPIADALPRTSYLKLAVSYVTGEEAESVWPVGSADHLVGRFFEEHSSILTWLLDHLPTAQEIWLREATPSGPALRAAPTLDAGLRLDLCSLLQRRILVIAGTMSGTAPHSILAVRLGAQSLAIQGRLLVDTTGVSAAARDVEAAMPDVRFALVVGVSEAEAQAIDVVVEIGEGSRRSRVRRSLAPESSARDDFTAQLNALAPDVALGLLDRVAAELGAEADPPAWLLATLAATVERLPSSIEAMGDGLALHCDALVAVGAEGIYVSGWVHAGENLLASVTCHGEFQSQRIDDTWVRSPRKDVIEFLASRGIHSTQHEPGFVAFVALPASSTCRLVVTTPTGTSRAMRLPRTAPTTAMASIRAVLTSFNVKHPSLRRLLDAQVGPAVETAWAHRAKPPRRVTVQRFGPAVPKPSVSVIVPLYGRCDFADYQMALFADDSDFQALELIYFVDDPTLYDEFRPQCDDLFATYQVPFTLATAGANFGFAGANNCAAGIACGQRFLLMNSDVFPMRPGWVSQMLAIYAKLDQPGCLGTKLLYEDGSVQHAGMAFRRHAPWGELWLNDHPHKGQSAKGLTGLQPAAAVTAACVMVDAALYRELGGLSEDYIIGDFEDSDFCLRAAAAGRRHWVALDIELYHLERQSQNRIGDSNWRTNVTLYNGWLHTQRWGAALEKLAR